MTKRTRNRTDAVFAAIAHPTRRAILRRLANGNLSIGDLAAPLSMSLAGASKHMNVLQRAGLVERHDCGWLHVCALNRDALQPVHVWLDEMGRPPA